MGGSAESVRMRRKIYVKNGHVWNNIMRKAKEVGVSPSEYLLDGEHHPDSGPFSDQLDRIENMLIKLLGPVPKNASEEHRTISTKFERNNNKEKIDRIQGLMG